MHQRNQYLLKIWGYDVSADDWLKASLGISAHKELVELGFWEKRLERLGIWPFDSFVGHFQRRFQIRSDIGNSLWLFSTWRSPFNTFAVYIHHIFPRPQGRRLHWPRKLVSMPTTTSKTTCELYNILDQTTLSLSLQLTLVQPSFAWTLETTCGLSYHHSNFPCLF